MMLPKRKPAASGAKKNPPSQKRTTPHIQLAKSGVTLTQKESEPEEVHAFAEPVIEQEGSALKVVEPSYEEAPQEAALQEAAPQEVVSQESGLQESGLQDSGFEQSGYEQSEIVETQHIAHKEPVIEEHVTVAEAIPEIEKAGGENLQEALAIDGSELGVKSTKNSQYMTTYRVEKPGFAHIGNPTQMIDKLAKVGYECLHFLAVQMGLLLNTPTTKIRALLLEGPSGCGKSYMAKSLAKITGAELMCLSCYKGMLTQNLIESPSTLALANAMTGKSEGKAEDLMNLGILSRAYLKSQSKPVILLIDELDKTDGSIDTFFLGPVQDARIWLESRPPIDADPENLLIIFTKNFNRVLDEAFLRRCHPIKMTYLDSTLERKILSPHCHPQLVANLVTVADRMRNSGGSYAFERPPAPEELLTAGHYVTQLLDWGMNDFGFVGKNIWAILAKSEHDRAVLEHMMRFHPDFMDPLIADGRDASVNDVHARLGRIVLKDIVADPDKERRERAWEDLDNY